MKTLLILLATSAVGCAGYTQSKIDLVFQAQRGVTEVRAEVDAARVRAVEAGEALRGRLDAAFDEDVTSRGGALDAEWVITHRKAYALAVDTFDADRRAADAAGVSTLRTLDAIAAALTQLQQMHAAELKLTLPELPTLQVSKAQASEVK